MSLTFQRLHDKVTKLIGVSRDFADFFGLNEDTFDLQLCLRQFQEFFALVKMEFKVCLLSLFKGCPYVSHRGPILNVSECWWATNLR